MQEERSQPATIGPSAWKSTSLVIREVLGLAGFACWGLLAVRGWVKGELVSVSLAAVGAVLQLAVYLIARSERRRLKSGL
jgi:hypothetical protein